MSGREDWLTALPPRSASQGPASQGASQAGANGLLLRAERQGQQSHPEFSTLTGPPRKGIQVEISTL